MSSFHSSFWPGADLVNSNFQDDKRKNLQECCGPFFLCEMMQHVPGTEWPFLCFLSCRLLTRLCDTKRENTHDNRHPQKTLGLSLTDVQVPVNEDTSLFYSCGRVCTNTVINTINISPVIFSCVFHCRIFWASAQFRSVVPDLWMHVLLFCCSVIHWLRFCKEKENLLESSRQCKLWGEQFRFGAFLRFYGKCTFSYTNYAQNIVLLSGWESVMWLKVKTGRVLCQCWKSHWLLWIEGNHGGIWLSLFWCPWIAVSFISQT